MPISYLMDRTTVNIAKAQVGFLDVIIHPSYTTLAVMLPMVEINVKTIESNKIRWQGLIETYEERTSTEKKKLEESFMKGK